MPLLIVVAAALVDAEGRVLVQQRPPGKGQHRLVPAAHAPRQPARQNDACCCHGSGFSEGGAGFLGV